MLNEDALKVIEEYYWDETCTLFIDPPYYVAWDKKLYHHCYQEEEHQKLADLLNTLVCGMPAHADILVTYDNHPFIAKLYQEAGFANVGNNFKKLFDSEVRTMFEKGKKYKIMEKTEIFLEEEVISIEKDSVLRCEEAGQQPVLMDIERKRILPSQAAVHLQSLLIME